MSALTTTTPKASALAIMASRFSVDPAKLLDTLKNTVFRDATDSQLMALVVVANEYGLNPFTKEIYAFKDSKSGGIVPVVGVDGWIAMMNRQEDFDGVEFEVKEENGKPTACTAIIYLKSRNRPVKVTEYVSECQRNTDPWNKSPRRMIRHRALIQAARIAFGFSGIVDEEDAELQGAKPANARVVEEVAPPKQTAKKLSGSTPSAPAAAVAPASEPAAETQTPEQEAVTEAIVDEPAADDAAKPADVLRKLAADSHVTEAQILAFLKDNGEEVTSLNDLGELQVENLAAKWSEMLPIIKGQPVNANTRDQLAHLMGADNVTEAKLMKWLKAKKHSDAPNLQSVAPHKIAWIVENWENLKAGIIG